MPPIHYTLLVLLSLWTRIITAELACISPTSTPSEIHPGRPIALGSLDGASVSTLSDITAHLVCSSTRTVALRLGGGYDATDFSPHSPSVTITTAQAATALSSCPSNSFHVEYTATALAGQQVAVHCKDVVSIQTTRSPVALDLNLPSLPIPLPFPGATTAPPVPEPSPPTTPPPEVTTPLPPLPQTTAPAESPKPSGPPAGAKTSRGSKPTYTPQPTAPSQGDGNQGGGTKTNPSGASSGPQEPSPSNKDSSPSSSEMQTEKTSTTTIIAVCGGILGGSLVILVTILVWRKREQRRQRVSFDQFYNESLTAASGFNEAESSSKNYKRDSNNSNSADNHARPAYARPSDLEQGYDGYPAGPGSAPPMRHHAGYRGGPAPMPGGPAPMSGGPGYGHGHHGHEYA